MEGPTGALGGVALTRSPGAHGRPDGGAQWGAPGRPRTLDLFYLFGAADNPAIEIMSVGPSERRMPSIMQTCWGEFARTLAFQGPL